MIPPIATAIHSQREAANSWRTLGTMAVIVVMAASLFTAGIGYARVEWKAEAAQATADELKAGAVMKNGAEMQDLHDQLREVNRQLAEIVKQGRH